MKRSEAVEIIAKRLCPLGISEPTCEEVLELLEKAGMVPPPYTKKVKYPHTNFVQNVSTFQWEPEDE